MTKNRNVASRGEVEAVMEQAKRAGTEIVKAAQDTFWGGYLRDPDGHLWEDARSPQWKANQ